MEKWKGPTRLVAGALLIGGVLAFVWSRWDAARDKQPVPPLDKLTIEDCTPAALTNPADGFYRLEGVVYGSDGRPLSGADVWTEETGDFYLDSLHTESNTQGRFVFQVPVAATRWESSGYRRKVWVFARDHELAHHDYFSDIYSVESPGPLQIHLAATSNSTTVRILDPQGEPVVGAKVGTTSAHLEKGYSTVFVPESATSTIANLTDGDGRVQVSNIEGAESLYIQVATKSYGLQGFSLTDDDDQPLDTVRLRPVGRIEGQLLSDKVDWVSGASLRLVTLIEAGGAAGSAIVKTDKNGAFEVSAIGAGELRIVERFSDGVDACMPAYDSIQVQANDVTKVRLRLVRGVRVNGQLWNTRTDSPLANSRIRLYYSSEKGRIDYAFTDDAGRFEIRVRPERIVISTIDAPQAQVMFDSVKPRKFDIPGDTDEFQLPKIEVTPDERIHGLLLDQAGRRLGNVTIDAASDRGRGAWGTADSQGRITLFRRPNRKCTSYRVRRQVSDGYELLPAVKVQDNPLVLQITDPDEANEESY